jgi:hypothetical protein
MSAHIAILRSAMAFIERREGHYSAAMLAANVAFIVAAIVWINVWTLMSLATAVVPDTKRIVTPFSAVALGVVLWIVVYALARREVARVRVEGSRLRGSPRSIVIYAIASALALFASIALMAVN